MHVGNDLESISYSYTKSDASISSNSITLVGKCNIRVRTKDRS